MDSSEEIPVQSAVYIRNLCKSYGNGPPVLKNICMNVKKGSIYGLLGASGCGKTSLLSCIVGAHKWDSGELFVLGKRRVSNGNEILGEKCGYMPQDISLYDSLTFREMAAFFGKLYNMPQQDLKLQVKFLAHLLDMTSVDQQIETLSGGGKRRVSLALTLIHSPDLLILDEPLLTVGLDPMLRQSIWEHLYNLALNHGKTVVITTHYTEEAKLANKIGIMRNGRFLAEDTPANLIQAFNCNLLEEVTLKLCRADEISNQISSDTSPPTHHKMNKFKFKSSWKETVTSAVAKHDGHSVGVFKRSTEFDTIITNDVEIPRFNLSRRTSRLDSFFHELKKVQGIAMVQGLSVLRQKVFLAFFVLLPTIQGSIMFNTMGRQPRLMKVGVVNNELLNWTSQCNSESFVNESCDFTFLSCKFIHEIQSSDIVNLIPFNSEEDARPKALEGHVKGYITFPANFSDYTLESLATRPFPSNESMDGSRIGMHLDFSQYVESLFMLLHFLESHSTYLQHLAESCQINKNVAKVPLRKPVYESLDDSYTEFFVPGIMLCAIIVCVASITAILYLNDKNNGTLGRGQVAGLKTGHILLGYLLTQGFLGLLQTFLWSLTCYVWLGYTIRGSILLYVLICILVIVCGVSLGLLMGIACSDALQSLVITMFFVPFIIFYGGVLWPLQGMPKYSQYIAYFIPTTLPTLSIRSVIVRGLSLTHPLVWPGVVSIIVWIVAVVFIIKVFYKK